MSDNGSGHVTELLQQWKQGDAEALDALLPLVYKDLRRLAHYHLQSERSDHTLQSTALVHEGWFFGGLSSPEISEAMGISRATVDRDWSTARIWLHRQMTRTAAAP